jgi:hypothetical protein
MKMIFIFYLYYTSLLINFSNKKNKYILKIVTNLPIETSKKKTLSEQKKL